MEPTGTNTSCSRVTVLADFLCFILHGRRWIRRFHRDPTKVEKFDSDYWFVPSSSDEDGLAQADASSDAFQQGLEGQTYAQKLDEQQHAKHVLYTRPANQPATPWSAAGGGGGPEVGGNVDEDAA